MDTEMVSMPGGLAVRLFSALYGCVFLILPLCFMNDTEYDTPDKTLLTNRYSLTSTEPLLPSVLSSNTSK